MGRRVAALFGLALAALVLCVSPAHADGGPVLVDDDYEVELKFDDAGAAAATVTLINTGASDMRVVAKPRDAGVTCRPVGTPITVPRYTQQDVKLKFTGCTKGSKDSVLFTLARAAAPSLPLFPVLTASPESPEESPDWSLLWWFTNAGVAGALLLGVTWLVWGYVPPRSLNLFKPLPGLDSSWTFKESWASNATVIAAAFTGVFGVTELATTIFGESDAKELTSLLAVATAMAVGLAGLAPLLLQTFRSWTHSQVTPFGLLLAGTCTLAATGGELAIAVKAAGDTALLQDVDWLEPIGIAGALMLAAYAISATVQNLVTGTTEPPPEPKPVSVKELIDYAFDKILGKAVRSRYLDVGNDDQGRQRAEEDLPQEPEGDINLTPQVQTRRRTAIL